MDVKDEIVARIDKLPPDMQEQVLQFVASLQGRRWGRTVPPCAASQGLSTLTRPRR